MNKLIIMLYCLLLNIVACAQKGNDTFYSKYEELNNKIIETVNIDSNQDLTLKMFDIFDSIHFDCLQIIYSEPNREGLGDISHLLFVGKNGKVDENVFKHIKADISEESAWQIYLLSNLQHWLPTFWHGRYKSRTPLLSNNDKTSLFTPDYFCIYEGTDIEAEVEDGCISKADYKKLLDIDIQKYIVVVDYERNRATIKCCYWNEWEGLILESVTYQYGTDKSISIIDKNDSILFKYNCGILF